jgi:phthalate 4,5-dioxygenase
MRDGSWSGIAGANVQDIAVEESMGPIYDRTKEQLGTSDIAVIRMRRLMIEAARALEQGEAPVGVGADVPDISCLRAEEALLPLDEPWERLSAYGSYIDE